MLSPLWRYQFHHSAVKGSSKSIQKIINLKEKTNKNKLTPRFQMLAECTILSSIHEKGKFE